MNTPLEDGQIELDSERGKRFDFTSDRYFGWLWKKDNAIYISFIESKKKGNFKALVEAILRAGFSVKIPTPLGYMGRIVTKPENGYRYTVEQVEEIGESVEVFVLDPK